MVWYHIYCVLMCLLVSTSHGVDFPFPVDLGGVLDQMQEDVQALAAQVELLYLDRCSETESDCADASFDACLSEFPFPNCSTSNVDYSPVCNGTGCGAMADFTVSAVSTGPGSKSTNPKDERIIESICFARKMDDWLKTRISSQAEYWNAVKTRPSSYFFASVTGTFRSYPARPSETCTYYDPRVRPWYLAASSGPKSVILILDVSGSMRGRLSDLRWAARQVVEELTEDDWVSVIVFAAQSRLLVGTDSLVRANETNKDQFDDALKGLQEETGSANFASAFDLAFDLLDKVYTDTGTLGGCHASILVVTSSAMDGQVEKEALVEQVQVRMNDTKENSNQPVQLFMHSMADLESTTQVGVHDFPMQLACASELGFWKRIGQDDDLRVVLPSYVNLYSWGLGNRPYPFSWVKPYPFFVGGINGTTVSAPVFSSSGAFLGVVGIDIGLEPLFDALGASPDAFDIRPNEEENCPRILDLDECKVEAYRRLGGLNCSFSSNCSEAVQVQDTLCTNVTYPAVLWDNVASVNLDYANRACCNVATSNSGQCTSEDQPSSLSEEIALAGNAFTSAPAPAPPRDDGGGKEDRMLWEIVVTVIGTVLGGIVSILFLVDYFRNGSICRRRQEEEVFEHDEAQGFHHDIAP